jgi:conjugative transfer region protein TrbK
MRRRIFTQAELDRPKAIRIVAVLAAGALTAGAAAWLAGTDVEEATSQRAPAAVRATDPLQIELHRCNGIGEAALQDVACRAAWAENRRRFFGSPNRQPPSVNETRTAPVAEGASR